MRMWRAMRMGVGICLVEDRGNLALILLIASLCFASKIKPIFPSCYLVVF